MKQDGVVVEKVLAHDFFAIFDLQRSFFIDLETLEIRYIKLQKEMRENEDGEDMIAVVNEAYQTLNNDYSRVNYLISLTTVDQNLNLDPEKLEYFLELQDVIDEKKNLPILQIDLQTKQQNLMTEMEKTFFIEKNLQKTEELFADFKFLSRLILHFHEKINNIKDRD